MNTVDELIALSFHDRHRAAQALNLLCQSNDKLVIELDDAVIVHRDRDGNLEFEQDFTATANCRLMRAGLWGSLLGGLAAIAFAVVANEVVDPMALGACAWRED